MSMAGGGVPPVGAGVVGAAGLPTGSHPVFIECFVFGISLRWRFQYDHPEGVVDPRWFQCWSGSGSSFFFFNADPDPGSQTIRILILARLCRLKKFFFHQNIFYCRKVSVSYTHWINADPDPAFYLNADPDPGSKTNAVRISPHNKLDFDVKNRLCQIT